MTRITVCIDNDCAIQQFALMRRMQEELHVDGHLATVQVENTSMTLTTDAPSHLVEQIKRYVVHTTLETRTRLGW